MKVCSDPTLTHWTPDFSSSGQASPDWTKVSCAGVEVCNSLEWVDWSQNPVQVRLCDACGSPGCDLGGYIHISRLGDFVLWTTPQIDAIDEFGTPRYAPASALKHLGAIAIPADLWTRWRTVAPEVPQASTFPEANRWALADAWILGGDRPIGRDALAPMLRSRLLGCDTMEPSQAIDRVQWWVDHLSAPPTTRATGALRAPEEIGARIETLYFDGPSNRDWPAFAIRDEAEFLLLDRQHAFVPFPQG